MAELATSRTVTVINPQGLHARPAHSLVTTANGFKARIRVIRNGEAVDGKSILSLLTLAAVAGTQLKLEAIGEDAEAALDALESLFLSGFGGDEVQDEQETSADESANSGRD